MGIPRLSPTTKYSSVPSEVSGSDHDGRRLAAFLQAGMDGVKHSLDPGEPNLGNMYEMPVATMRERGIEVVPQTLPEALAALEADPVVQSALGPDLYQEFLNVKRLEWTRYHNQITPWELDRYLTLF